MTDYRQADLDEARTLVPDAHPKAQERVARALAKRERLGAERRNSDHVVPLLHVVAEGEVQRG